MHSKSRVFAAKPLSRAITATILALAGKTALAAPCPNVPIAGTIAGCTLSGGSSATVLTTGWITSGVSVTSAAVAGVVTNSGTISGVNALLVDGGSTLDSLSNSGVMNGAGDAIWVGNSSAINSIINNGAINALGEGVVIASGSSADSIVNNGTISANTAGVVVGDATVTGDVTNNGTITSNLLGLQIYNSTVGSNVQNKGLIDGKISTAFGDGILVSDSDIAEDLINTGTITNVSYAIHVNNSSSITGNVTNSGTITHAVEGVVVEGSSSVEGDVTNAGYISAPSYTGLGVWFGATVAGNVVNDGTISANKGFLIYSASVKGSIVNNGAVNADYGIHVNVSSSIMGNVTNSGSITNASYGVVVEGSSNVAGDVVNTGNISASNTGLGVWYSATVAGNVVNDSAISAQYGVGIYSATVNGSIVNSGTINSSGTGVYVENTSTVAGGLTNSGTIAGGSYAVYVDSSSTLPTIDLVGSNAHLIGDVFAQNTDVNVTSGAVFTSEGRFDVQSFNVANGATFNMTDDITVAAGLNNSGVVSLADASLMTVTGDYLGAGGVLRTNVSSASSYGQLAVTGTAAVGAVNVALAPGASLASGDILTDVLVSSSAPLSGMPSVTDNSTLWNFSAVDNGNNGFDLTTSLSSTVGQDMPALLSGQNIQATGALLDSVLDIVESGSSLSGMSSGDAMVSAPGKLWVKGYGSSSDRSNDAGVYGYDADGRGTVIGADTSLSDGLVVGGAIAYGTNNVDGKDGLSGHHIDSDVFQAIAYTGKDLGDSTYFTAQGVYGSANNDGTRQFSDLGLMQEAKSDFDSWFTNLRGEYGKNYTSGNMTIMPNANISYVYVNQGSFTEKGSTLNEHVKEYDGDSLVVGAGANLAYRIKATPKQNVILTGHLGAGYDFMNNADNVKFTIAGGPATEFTSQGADQDEWVIRGGVGVKTDGIGPFEIGVNYDIQSSSNYDGGVFSAVAKYKF